MTALKLAGVNVKTEESALYDSQSDGLAESAVKGVKDAVRTNLACLVRRVGQEFPGGLRGDGEQVQERSRWQDSLRTARGVQVCASTAAFCGEDPLHDPGVTKGVARVEPRWEDGTFLGVSDQSDELYVGTERDTCTRFEQSDVARPQNELTSRS